MKEKKSKKAKRTATPEQEHLFRQQFAAMSVQKIPGRTISDGSFTSVLLMQNGSSDLTLKL